MGWLKERGEKVLDTVLVGGAVAALGIAGAALQPILWGWIKGIDAEVARRGTFILTIMLLVIWRIAPRPRLPVRVVPIRESGQEAFVAVENLGAEAEFYGRLDILDVKQGGEAVHFRRLSLLPVWASREMSGYPDRIQLKRDEVGNLVLVRKRDRYSKKDDPVKRLEIVDAIHSSSVVFEWDQMSPDAAISIRLRVKIMRNDKTPWFRRALPSPRSYEREFIVTCDSADSYSVAFAPPE